MNSLEFIADEIKVLTKRIKKLKEEEDLHWNYEHEDEAIECNFQREEYEDLLKAFQQIKTILEAWEVIKKYGIYYYKEDDYLELSLIYSNCPENINFQKLIKALEVEDD